MKSFALAAAVVLLAATSPVWLDAKVLSNWNVAGSQLPAAPGPRDPGLAPGGQCASMVRPPSMPEDRAVTGKGWLLIDSYQRFGNTSLVMGTSSADGMCRPNGFQGFVFVGGAFAGTIAPHPMDARSDASLGGYGVTLVDAQDLAGFFTRYDAQDALCCPHATTTVQYKIAEKSGHAVLTPISAFTTKNSQ